MVGVLEVSEVVVEEGLGVDVTLGKEVFEEEELTVEEVALALLEVVGLALLLLVVVGTDAVGVKVVAAAALAVLEVTRLASYG